MTPGLLVSTIVDMRVYPAKTGKYVTCPVCSTVSYRFPSQVKKGYKDYCSKECWYSYMPIRLKEDVKYKDGVLKGLANGATRRKEVLQSEEYRKKASTLFKQYAKEGRLTPRYGINNNFWKGGIASLQNKARQTLEYKDWRKAIYEYDNYRCVVCDTNEDLHAHHVLSFADYPELRYDTDNGVTLCRSCHSDYHGRYLPDISNANRRK